MSHDESSVITQVSATRTNAPPSATLPSGALPSGALPSTALPSGTPSAAGPFRQTSPSYKTVFLLVSAGIGVAIGWLLIANRPEPLAMKKYNDLQMMERLIPKTEVTPEYIHSISQSLGSRSLKPKREEGEFFSEGDPDGAGEERSHKKPDAHESSLETPPRLSSMMIYGSSSLQHQLGNLGVAVGTEVRAVLEKTVIADDRSVPVIARISRDVIQNGQVVLPRDARLFGQTQGTIENRIHVKFDRVIFPNGKEHPFSGIALDSSGSGGIPGKLKQKHARRGLGVISQAALGATSVFAPMGQGFTDAAIRGAERGGANEAGRDWNYYRQTEAMPTVTLRAETEFVVLIDQPV